MTFKDLFSSLRSQLGSWLQSAGSWLSATLSAASRLITKTVATFRPANEKAQSAASAVSAFVAHHSATSARRWLAWAWGLIHGTLGAIWSFIGSLLKRSKPSPALGFVGMPALGLGLLAPLISGLKILAIVAMFWGGLWAWGERRYNKGHAAGYQLAVQKISHEINADSARKEEDATTAVANLAPTPATPIEMKALCASDPD